MSNGLNQTPEAVDFRRWSTEAVDFRMGLHKTQSISESMKLWQNTIDLEEEKASVIDLEEIARFEIYEANRCGITM